MRLEYANTGLRGKADRCLVWVCAVDSAEPEATFFRRALQDWRARPWSSRELEAPSSTEIQDGLEDRVLLARVMARQGPSAWSEDVLEALSRRWVLVLDQDCDFLWRATTSFWNAPVVGASELRQQAITWRRATDALQIEFAIGTTSFSVPVMSPIGFQLGPPLADILKMWVSGDL